MHHSKLRYPDASYPYAQSLPSKPSYHSTRNLANLSWCQTHKTPHCTRQIQLRNTRIWISLRSHPQPHNPDPTDHHYRYHHRQQKTCPQLNWTKPIDWLSENHSSIPLQPLQYHGNFVVNFTWAPLPHLLETCSTWWEGILENLSQ